MSARKRLGAAAAAAMFASGGAIAASPIVSTFDAGTEGWTAVTTQGSPGWAVNSAGLATTFEPADGHPGGSLRFSDTDTGWSYFAAPGSFLGDLSAYVGGTLSFDTRTVVPGSSGYSNEAEVVLFGAGLILVHDALTALPSDWTPVSVPLAAGNWRLTDTFGGALASQQQVAGVLANLDGLWINAEYHTPVDETIGLDNVRIAPIPEPSRAVLLLAGLGAIGWTARRTRRRTAAA